MRGNQTINHTSYGLFLFYQRDIWVCIALLLSSLVNANLCQAQHHHQPRSLQHQRLVTNLKANDTCQVINMLDQFKELFFYTPEKQRVLEKFQCIESEQLLIHKWAWISIPRHLRTSGNTTPTPTVFSQDNVSPGYDYINIDYNNIHIIDPAGTLRPEFAKWDIPYGDWYYQSGEESVMKDIVSTRGYVMNAEPDGNRVLLMDGTVEDPETEMELYCKKENWIGYFLPEEQNVFDALADIEEDIYHIKHEDYTCWRYDYNISNVCTDGFKSGDALSPGTWVCNGQPVIKYGEMIKVSPLHNISDFKWNNSGKPSSGEIRPKVEYYVYEKLADYNTFVIELDTTETKPTEIAAFVNNSCVGACSVQPTDTVVVLSAYLGEQPGDSVVFEQHYGTTKQSNRAITNYLVKDNQRQVFERKAIRTGEKREAYIISFNPEKLTNPIAGTTAELTLYPNPASHSVLLNVMLERKGYASMEVYDMQGRQVKVLISEELPAGNTMFNWDLTNRQGIRLQTGAYVVRLTTDQLSTTRKLLVE